MAASPRSIPVPTLHNCARVLKRLSLAFAALAASGTLLNVAHATYPGENGVIVFDSWQFPRSLGRVSPGGGVPVTLTEGWGPKVSPNGKKVAFMRGAGNTPRDIFLMNIDGSNIVKLTDAPNAVAVTWLPDGSRLAYATATNVDGLAQLWTMNPDGSGKTFVRDLKNAVTALDWSPSGPSFAFVGSDVIYVSDVVNPIPPGRYLNSDPAWAPDGLSIMVGNTQNELGEAQEIMVDGSGRKTLPPQSLLTGRNAISPDGKLIGAGILYSNFKLATRARAGLPIVSTWDTQVSNVDWARVPKNCSISTPAGGGSVLAGDVDGYANQCAVAILPGAMAAGGVLGQALAIGPDGRLYGRLLKVNASGGAPLWGSPYVIPGGSGAPGGINPAKVAIAGAKDGSFQAVIINSVNQAVYHAMQYPNGTWSGFNLLDGSAGAPSFQARDVAIAINGSSASSPGNAQVIANGLLSGDLYHRVRWPSGTWTGFAVVPGSAGMNSNELAIASSDDLYTNVLAVTTAADGSQGQIRQVIRDPSGNWGGWVTMPVLIGTTLTATSDVALARTTFSGNPVAQVLFVDSTGNSNLQIRNNPNLVSSWQGQVINGLMTNQSRTVSISAGGGSPSTLLTTRVYPQ